MVAAIQEKAKLKRSSSPMVAAQPVTPASGRKPTRRPTTTITTMTNAFRARSAMVRPVRTAERAMGSERNRSTSPF